MYVNLQTHPTCDLHVPGSVDITTPTRVASTLLRCSLAAGRKSTGNALTGFLSLDETLTQLTTIAGDDWSYRRDGRAKAVSCE